MVGVVIEEAWENDRWGVGKWKKYKNNQRRAFSCTAFWSPACLSCPCQIRSSCPLASLEFPPASCRYPRRRARRQAGRQFPADLSQGLARWTHLRDPISLFFLSCGWPDSSSGLSPYPQAETNRLWGSEALSCSPCPQWPRRAEAERFGRQLWEFLYFLGRII